MSWLLRHGRVVVAGALLAAVLTPVAGRAATTGPLPVRSLLAVVGGPASCAAYANDALQRSVLGALDGWAAWLSANHARGFLGELGWPDDSRGDGAAWSCLAEAYYARLDALGLPALAWTASERPFPSSLVIYRSAAPGLAVSRRNVQANVLARHPTTRRYLRGVGLVSGEQGFGQDAGTIDTNSRPGVYGVTYAYPSAATYRYLAAQGIGLVRLPFRWERVQPVLGRPLDTVEIGHLRASVRAARAAGLAVVLDLHNYAGYYVTSSLPGGVRRLALGSPQLPVADFADLWARLSRAFRDTPGVEYGLMNEPIGMPGATAAAQARLWERASQAAVTAIRAGHDRSWISVSGYGWDSLVTFARMHPRAWITDPADRVIYEAHHYWDLNHSSEYAMTYPQELAWYQAHR